MAYLLRSVYSNNIRAFFIKKTTEKFEYLAKILVKALSCFKVGI